MFHKLSLDTRQTNTDDGLSSFFAFDFLVLKLIFVALIVNAWIVWHESKRQRVWSSRCHRSLISLVCLGVRASTKGIFMFIEVFSCAQIKSPKSLSYAPIHVPFSSSSLFALKLLLALSSLRTFLVLKSPIISRDDDDADSEPKNFRSFVLRRLSHFSNNFSNSLSHFALNLRKLFWNCILLSSTLVSDELCSLSLSCCCCSWRPFGCAPNKCVGMPRVL